MKTVTNTKAAPERFCRDAFVGFGFTGKEAAQITDVLMLADLYGIRSHGTQRLVRYHKAIEKGSVRIAVTNSESIMVHTGSRQAVMESNPIAFAAPAEPVPFWFDAATTVVPKGKLEVYRKADEPLCDGWAVDEMGAVSTDAERVLHCIDGKVGAGGILPVGGAAEESGSHKGCGYSMICELLCAITSGGATSNHHVREGIEVDISTVAEIMEICRTLGMDSRDYLGDVDVAGAKKSVY